jgi:shikimate kinase
VEQDGGKRPLMDTHDKATAVRELMQARQPIYEAVADINVSTARLSPEIIADRIISELKSHADFSF